MLSFAENFWIQLYQLQNHTACKIMFDYSFYFLVKKISTPPLYSQPAPFYNGLFVISPLVILLWQLLHWCFKITTPSFHSHLSSINVYSWFSCWVISFWPPPPLSENLKSFHPPPIAYSIKPSTDLLRSCVATKWERGGRWGRGWVRGVVGDLGLRAGLRACRVGLPWNELENMKWSMQ